MYLLCEECQIVFHNDWRIYTPFIISTHKCQLFPVLFNAYCFGLYHFSYSDINIGILEKNNSFSAKIALQIILACVSN